MPKLRIGEPLRQQIQGFQNRKSGADQRHELLVENEELFEIELASVSAQFRDSARGLME